MPGNPSASAALVENVDPDKTASAFGIQPGDIIVAVNQAPVRNARQADQAIAQAGKAGKKSVLLLVERGDAQMFVAVPFASG
ncbi:MAG: PDZ domain-containing protein [Mesorhizobium sp.]|nr:MAG: PDZ domain-containing protein [Mesorhizobium sp.]